MRGTAEKEKYEKVWSVLFRVSYQNLRDQLTSALLSVVGWILQDQVTRGIPALLKDHEAPFFWKLTGVLDQEAKRVKDAFDSYTSTIELSVEPPSQPGLPLPTQDHAFSLEASPLNLVEYLSTGPSLSSLAAHQSIFSGNQSVLTSITGTEAPDDYVPTWNTFANFSTEQHTRA